MFCVRVRPACVAALGRKSVRSGVARRARGGFWSAVGAKLLISAAVLGLVPSSLQSRERITFDEGGLVQQRIRWVAAAEGPIVIDGLCFSACTLVLSRRDVCVTPRAILGFHEAFHKTTGLPAPEATAGMYAMYPAPVRAWIDRHGGLTRRPLLVAGDELRALVRPCDEAIVASP